MMTNDQILKLTDARCVILRVTRNMKGTGSAVMTASRNADRLVIANDLIAMRLGLLEAQALLREVLDANA